MKKFKKDIIDGNKSSIVETFGDEPTFTDHFLIIPNEFGKIIRALGRNDEIESIECQIKTSDGKELDNLVVLTGGERIALEAQIGTSDMSHIAKLPYYMDNLRYKDDGEIMMGILMAEEFTQEAIDYYETLNQISYLDLYLVKANLIEVDGKVIFDPQLISPTPTTNYTKNFKKHRDNLSGQTPNTELADLVESHLEDLGYPAKRKDPNNRARIDFEIRQKEWNIWISVSYTGTISFGIWNASDRSIPHPNEDIFKNNQGYARLKEMSAAKNLDEFKSGFDILLQNL